MTLTAEPNTDAIVLEQRFEHNHPPNAFAVAKRQIKYNARQIAERFPKITASDAVMQALKGASESVVSDLKIEHLKRNVCRQKMALRGKEPKITAENVNFEISEDFLRFSDGTSFILYDSLIDPSFVTSGFDENTDRLLILGGAHVTQQLETTNEWALDDSVSKKPKFFPLFLTLFCPIGDDCFRPSLFVLATQKNRRMFDFMLTTLLQLMPKLNPTRILMEYEKDLMDAFVEKFGAQLIFHGYFYHLWQSFYAQIVHNNLNLQYGNDLEFAMISKYLLCLTFLPDYKIHEGFTIIFNHARSKFDNLMDPLLNYFQTQYVGILGQMGGQMQCQPQVSIPFWNISNRVIDDFIRISIPCEAWKRAQNKITKSESNIWQSLQALQEISSNQIWNDPSIPIEPKTQAKAQRLIHVIMEKQRELMNGELAMLGFFREISTKLDIFM